MRRIRSWMTLTAWMTRGLKRWMRSARALLASVMVVIVLLLASRFPLAASAAETSSPSTSHMPHVAAAHAYAIEYQTGRVLLDQDGDEPAGIASMTKLITLYLTYKAVAQGKLTWSTKVHVSDYSYQVATNPLTTSADMSRREFTVSDLVNAAMLPSANSAAISLAERIGGSEPKFVDLMRAQVRAWGITDARIYNASGLNNSFLGSHIYPGSSSKAENALSAKDMAIVAWHLIHDYPSILTISKKTQASFGGKTISTTNHMLPGEEAAYPGVDGLKTGTTDEAGACFTATALVKGMRVIAVVQKADKADADPLARFKAMKTLFDYCYQAYRMVIVVSRGKQYKGSTVAVQDGQERSVIAVADRDWTLCLSTEQRAVFRKVSLGDAEGSNRLRRMGLPVFRPRTSPVSAPVRKNQTLGVLTIEDDGSSPSSSGKGRVSAQGAYLDLQEGKTISLVAQKEVKKTPGFWERVGDGIRNGWNSFRRTVVSWFRR